jgi:hypothetical protein
MSNTGTNATISTLNVQPPTSLRPARLLLTGHSVSRPAQRSLSERRKSSVLYTIAVILLVLWLLGMVSGYTIGAFIHVLLVIAIVLFLVQIISGRSAVP